jgi:hypothetical protein
MTIAAFTDDDARRSIGNAVRMVVIAAVLGVPLLWWKLGWASAALFAVGALISGTGLFEWLRLMSALMARMAAAEAVAAPAPVKPLAPVMIGFFLRLGGAVIALYVSLKYLQGSVFALAAGLALGAAALLVEGLRLVRSWTA